MRTEQVHAVLAIAETSSFRAAASRLGVSQSALSGSVRRLEDELGVALLLRSHEGTTLSPAGAAALSALRAVGAADLELRSALQSFAAGQTVELVRLAAVTAAINTVLPDCLKEFVVDPAVEVQVRIGGAGDVIDKVRNAEADLGVITLEQGAERIAGLRVQTLLTADMGVAMPADHPLMGRSELRVADLAGERVVNFRDGYMMHGVAARLLDPTEVRVVSHVESTPDAVRLVAAGMGVCLLPEFSVAERDGVRWRRLGDVDEPIELALVTAVGGNPTPRVLRLASQIRRHSRVHHNAASANTAVRVTV
ncbi:LysR family transcriptional regulator [Gordonia sp. CPCC 206044]|uniref:LysR family transcriptional regulator n=1 Tax=Gordonia sp. CPCC 206044 TaxID=3140793 RepID=UPI003AF34F9B